MNDVACRILWVQEANTLIAGGVNIITNQDSTTKLDRGRLLSKTGNWKTFCDEKDDYRLPHFIKHLLP